MDEILKRDEVIIKKILNEIDDIEKYVKCLFTVRSYNAKK